MVRLLLLVLKEIDIMLHMLQFATLIYVLHNAARIIITMNVYTITTFWILDFGSSRCELARGKQFNLRASMQLNLKYLGPS